MWLEVDYYKHFCHFHWALQASPEAGAAEPPASGLCTELCSCRPECAHCSCAWNACREVIMWAEKCFFCLQNGQRREVLSTFSFADTSHACLIWNHQWVLLLLNATPLNFGGITLAVCKPIGNLGGNFENKIYNLAWLVHLELIHNYLSGLVVECLPCNWKFEFKSRLNQSKDSLLDTYGVGFRG